MYMQLKAGVHLQQDNTCSGISYNNDGSVGVIIFNCLPKILWHVFYPTIHKNKQTVLLYKHM